MDLNEYKKIALPELQQIFLARLQEVVDFLDKKNIEYFAIGGTALGAFRHHGFIPWDNDVDLGMTRENYARFEKVARQLENDHFTILGHQFSRPIEHGLIKIGLKGTFCPERGLKKNFDTHYHIDIFPYDSVPDDSKLAKKHAKKAKRIKDILRFKSKDKSSSLIKTIVLSIYQLFLLPFSTNKLAKKLNDIAQQYDSLEPNSRYLVNVMGAYVYEREMTLRDNVMTTSTMSFSNLKLKVPFKCDVFLKGVYGPNFMTPAAFRLDKDTYYALIKKDFEI